MSDTPAGNGADSGQAATLEPSPLELAMRALYAIRAQLDGTLGWVVREVEAERERSRAERSGSGEGGEYGRPELNAIGSTRRGRERVLNRRDIRTGAMPPTFGGPKETAAGEDSQPTEDVGK